MVEVIFKHTQRNFSERTVVEIGQSQQTCRFCRSSNCSFDNIAHSIPEFLGNKSIFTLDECDSCNRSFGQGIENDLTKFIPPSWFTKLKGKKGYTKKQVNGSVTLSSDDVYLNIESNELGSLEKHIVSKGSKFSTLNVYKALLKILVSLLPIEYLPEFIQSISWLRSNADFDVLNHKPIIIVGHKAPDFRMPIIMNIEVIRQQEGENSVYQLDAQFNNFYVNFAFSPKTKCIIRLGQVTPAKNKLDEINFQEIDLSDYKRKHNYEINIFALNSVDV